MTKAKAKAAPPVVVAGDDPAARFDLITTQVLRSGARGATARRGPLTHAAATTKAAELRRRGYEVSIVQRHPEA